MDRKRFTLEVPWPNFNKVRLARLLPTSGNVIFTLVIAGLLVLAQSVGALPQSRIPNTQSPSTGTIAYQGRLADAAGAPLTGTYNMIFRLYSVATGGTPLWTEQWTGSNGVRVSDGLFNVMLGSLSQLPISQFTNSQSLFLGITVGTDDEMQPRVQLGSVPFAVQALTVPDGSVTTGKIANGAVTQAKLGADVNFLPPDGSITTAKIADKAITAPKFASGTVINRYYIEWFSSETPCTTSSTTYVECGNTLGGGFISNFPPAAPGTVRQYRLMVANADTLTTEGSSLLRVYQRLNGATVYEFDLGRKWSWPDYQIWLYSPPISFNEGAHLEFQIRLTIPGRTLWVYRVWVMAEDVMR